jgi:hypothetical protein
MKQIIKVSEWLLLYNKWLIFQLYLCVNKLQFSKTMMIMIRWCFLFCTKVDKQIELDFYSGTFLCSSMIQQSPCRNCGILIYCGGALSTETKTLAQIKDKLNHIMLHQVHLVMCVNQTHNLNDNRHWLSCPSHLPIILKNQILKLLETI